MASRLGVSVRAALSASHAPHLDDGRRRDSSSSSFQIFKAPSANRRNRSGRTGLRTLRVSNEGPGPESYLHMWKNAVDREKKEKAFEKIAENVASVDDGGEEKGEVELEKKKSDEFQKILEDSAEERDRIQRLQVVVRVGFTSMGRVAPESIGTRHVPQETWYERFPHFGFFHCFDNSVQLRAVKKPSDMS